MQDKYATLSVYNNMIHELMELPQFATFTKD